jgi:hypothetical protein
MTADLERTASATLFGLAIWASALWYLTRGAIAANRGERSAAPDWICAHIVG